MTVELQSLPAILAEPAQRWTLADVPAGLRTKVRQVREQGGLGERLMEMGLTPGTEICVVRRGLFGDPLQVELRGYMLSLRRAQARLIDLDPMGP